MAETSSLCALMEHVYVLWGKPAKHSCWGSFFPVVYEVERGEKKEADGTMKVTANPGQKSSRVKNRSLSYLRGELQKKCNSVLSQSETQLPKPLPTIEDELQSIVWVVRWIVRDPESPFRKPLENPSSFKAEPFDKQFMKQYLAALQKDFSAGDEEIKYLRQNIDYLKGLLKTAASKGKRCNWPNEFGEDFIKVCEGIRRKPTVSDALADLFATLFIASLFGPKDYSWEFGYLSLPTITWETVRFANEFEKSAKENGYMHKYPILSRVVYDAKSEDERDYLICGERHSMKDLREARFGRMARNTVQGDVLYVPLADKQMKSCEQLSVSRRQARICIGQGGWVLRDWGSMAGTLVVGRNGERCLVGGENNINRTKVLQNGDILCFGHKKNKDGKDRADASIPCYLFTLAVDSSDLI